MVLKLLNDIVKDSSQSILAFTTLVEDAGIYMGIIMNAINIWKVPPLFGLGEYNRYYVPCPVVFRICEIFVFVQRREDFFSVNNVYVELRAVKWIWRLFVVHKWLLYHVFFSEVEQLDLLGTLSERPLLLRYDPSGFDAEAKMRLAFHDIALLLRLTVLLALALHLFHLRVNISFILLRSRLSHPIKHFPKAFHLLLHRRIAMLHGLDHPFQHISLRSTHMSHKWLHLLNWWHLRRSLIPWLSLTN